MRRRKAPVAVLMAIAVAGCGGDRGYVRTSIDNQRDFERTALEVHASDRGRDDGEAALQRIQAQLSASQFEAARKDAAAAVRRQPGSANAHTFLAVALENTGESAAAGKHYLRAASLAPDNGAALANYAGWLCAQGSPAESLQWFERAVAVPDYPNRAMAHAVAGVCAQGAGQTDLAGRHLRRAIELDATNATALSALARREFAAGRAFEARAFSERRLAAAPADPQALLLASQIEQNLGDSVAAARYVARLKAEFPDAAEARNSGMGDGGR